ncbi:MAG: TonB-dependent receptor [Bacteroidota bacterium]
MIHKIIIAVILLGGFQAFSQSIQGKIVDAETKEGVPFAQIALVDYQIEVKSDESGKFTIAGNYPEQLAVRVIALGYETFWKELSIQSSISIELTAIHLDLEEVTVSATGNELKRNSVTYVELKSIKELNEIPKSGLGQMLEVIPGVYNSSTGYGISKPVIRGLQGVRVLTFLNGVRLEGQQWGGDHGMGISELGIGTVEVLKGPASLMYGADALGGVLYLSNEKFAQQGKHQLTASSLFESNTLGSVNSLSYNGSIKKLKILAGGRFSSNADYQISDGRFVKNSRFQDVNGKLALGWYKGKWVANFRYDYSTSTVGIPGHTHDSIAEFEDFLSTEQLRKKTLPVQYLTNHIASLDNKFILGKHTIQVQTSFTFNQLIEYEEKVTIPELVLNTYNFPYKVNVETRQSEHLKFNYGLQGMYLFQVNSPKAEERLVPDAQQSDNGFYFLTSWNRKKWRLQGGLRFDMRVLNSSVDEKFTEAFSKTFFGYNFSLGANYAFSAKSIFRLNVSSGFRVPHLSELLSNGLHHGTFRYEIGADNLTTEKAIQLDFSYEFTGEHLSLVVNPFVTAIQDYIFIEPQDSIIDGVQVFRYQQSLAPVMQTGADLGIHWHPHFAHILHFESTVSYLAMFSDNSAVFSFVPQPRWTNAISARFEMKGKFKVENVALQYNYYFSQRTVSQFETTSADYGVLDIGTQLAWDGKVPIQLQLGCRNLTNANYINHLSRLKTLGVANPGRSFYAKLIINLNLKK